MGPAILTLVILALIGIGLVLYFSTLYNSLVQLKNDIDKAWAYIDVLLKQRHDELPKLIEACKGYMQYEQKTFQMIVEARNAYQKRDHRPRQGPGGQPGHGRAQDPVRGCRELSGPEGQ